MFPRPTVFAALSLVLLIGCKDREIATYRAPKDPPPVMPGPPPPSDDAASSSAPGNQSMANTAVPTASGSDLVWTAPTAWAAKPNGPMRKGSFSVKGDGGDADLSITAFPGSTGGLLANVNRWRGQLGLAPFGEGEMETNVVHLDAGDLHMVVVDFAGNAGDKSTRILGAIIPQDTDTWFFKLMGPDALVESQKPAFLEFLHTVKSR
ncbi:MAG TPA: hypothetical protein VGM64_10570 [Lacunisphaera sp.]|jgi:hypothetical protein